MGAAGPVSGGRAPGSASIDRAASPGCPREVRCAQNRTATPYRSTGSAFGYEMMLLTVEQRLSMVQVPVKYQPRVGDSSVTGNKLVKRTVSFGATSTSKIRVLINTSANDKYSFLTEVEAWAP